jgi:hypothetical protein
MIYGCRTTYVVPNGPLNQANKSKYPKSFASSGPKVNLQKTAEMAAWQDFGLEEWFDEV